MALHGSNLQIREWLHSPWPLRFALLVSTVALALIAGYWLAVVEQPLSRHAVAMQLLYQGRADQAANLFEQSRWQGVANYRAGRLLRAATAFSADDSIPSQYNLAGTLARLHRYDESIRIYQAILERQPEHGDAKFNLALVKSAARIVQEKREQQQADQLQAGIEPGEQNRAIPTRDASQDMIQTISDESENNTQNDSDQSGAPQMPNRSENQYNRGEFDGGDNSTNAQFEQIDATASGQINTPRDETVIEDILGKAVGAKPLMRVEESEMAEQILLRQIRDDPAVVLRARMRAIHERRVGESK